MALTVNRPSTVIPGSLGGTVNNLGGFLPNVGNAAAAWQTGNVGDIINFLKPQREAMLDQQLQRQLALQAPGLSENARQFDASLGLNRDQFGESQRQFNVGSELDRDRFAEMQRQFGMTFPESQRQFDIGSWLGNQHFYDQLGYNYATLPPQYLNSILGLLGT